MTRTETTTTKPNRHHHFLRTLAVVVVAVAAALAMAFVGDAQAKKRPPAPAPVQGPVIAFTSDRDGNEEIYKMNEDGSNQTNLTKNAARDHQAAVSPDGSKIAFVSTRAGEGPWNPEIYVMNADGSNQQRITRNDESNGYYRAVDEAPAWSPDGTKLAFMSQRNGNPEIYTMDADTGDNVENLTNNQAYDTGPSWSPDGVTIAFQTNRDGDEEIYFMDAHGHNPANLTGNKGGREVNYAPDPYPNRANRAFTRTVPNQDGVGYNDEIFEMSYLGVTQTNLTNNAAMDWLASYSGDGTKIAFTSTRSGNWDIYKMNRDGSSPVQLTTNSALDYDPDWAKKAPSQLK